MLTFTQNQSVASIDCSGFTGTLTLNTFALIVSGTVLLVSGMTANIGSGTIRLTGTSAQSVDLADKNVGTLEVVNTGGAVTLSNAPASQFLAQSNSADINVIVTAGDTFTWGSIGIGGDGGNDVVFRSSSVGTQYNVTVTGGATVQNLDVSDWNNGGAVDGDEVDRL